MDQNLLHLLVAGGLTLIGVIITAIIWRAAKVRTVVWWLGLSLIPISVYLLGLSQQTVDAYTTLRAWYDGLTLTPMVWTGFAALGLGVLLMLVSRVIPARPRKKRAAAPAVPAAPASPRRRRAGRPLLRSPPARPRSRRPDAPHVGEPVHPRGCRPRRGHRDPEAPRHRMIRRLAAISSGVAAVPRPRKRTRRPAVPVRPRTLAGAVPPLRPRRDGRPCA